MGVRLLNRFLKDNTFNCIQQYSLEHYRGKRIVIDANIYMYRYIGDNALIENYYLLCSLFRSFGIIPLFIFDGTPPEQKKDELKERSNSKKKAKEDIKNIENKIQQCNNDEEKKKLEVQKKDAQKQCIHLKTWHLHDIKSLIKSNGLQYIEAPGEADHLCAKYVKDGLAYACMSEDMDLFVHGCPRVLRYMSLTKQTVVEYPIEEIIKELDLTFTEFQEMCILSGTDYTKWITKNRNYTDDQPQKTIFNYYNDLKRYQRERLRKSPIQHQHLNNCSPYVVLNDDEPEYNTSFFEWCYNKDIINQDRFELLKEVQSMFDLENYPNLEDYLQEIRYITFNESQLRKILSYHKFY